MLKRNPRTDISQASESLLDSYSVFNLLTQQPFLNLIESHLPAHRERRYPPLDTLSMFVTQALSEDRSCQAAVNARIVHCLQHGLTPPSPTTSSYCEARRRLPQSLIDALWRAVGRSVSDSTDAAWHWHAKRVWIVDGTGISMPDSTANQGVWPQSTSQEPGLGFPQARLSVLSCAASGALVDAALGPLQGKHSGELAHLRELADNLAAGDVLLGDALYENYWIHGLLQQQGVDSVFEINGSRLRPPARQRRIMLKRPRRPDWMDERTWENCPETLTLRVVRSKQPGYRDRLLLTSQLDASNYPDAAIKALYKQRWDVETDLRSLKDNLGAGILSCRTPAMIRKEIGVHLLAYNLIRLIIADAAALIGRDPRSISFVHTCQICALMLNGNVVLDEKAWRQLLLAITAKKVRNRAGRSEPRAVKRRPKPRPLLDLPRSVARSFAYRYER